MCSTVLPISTSVCLRCGPRSWVMANRNHPRFVSVSGSDHFQVRDLILLRGRWSEEAQDRLSQSKSPFRGHVCVDMYLCASTGIISKWQTRWWLSFLSFLFTLVTLQGSFVLCAILCKYEWCLVSVGVSRLWSSTEPYNLVGRRSLKAKTNMVKPVWDQCKW